MTYSKKDSQEEQLELMRRMDGKMDLLAMRLDKIEKNSRNAGAIAGGISGGLVATGIALLKAKFGIY